jgi:hypothetical protein
MSINIEKTGCKSPCFLSKCQWIIEDMGADVVKRWRISARCVDVCEGEPFGPFADLLPRQPPPLQTDLKGLVPGEIVFPASIVEDLRRFECAQMSAARVRAACEAFAALPPPPEPFNASDALRILAVFALTVAAVVLLFAFLAL